EHQLHCCAHQSLVARVGDVYIEISDGSSDVIFRRAHFRIGELQPGRGWIGASPLLRVTATMIATTITTASSPTTNGVQLRSGVLGCAGDKRSAMDRFYSAEERSILDRSK